MPTTTQETVPVTLNEFSETLEKLTRQLVALPHREVPRELEDSPAEDRVRFAYLCTGGASMLSRLSSCILHSVLKR